ncbi:MAG: hypothetical protein QM674_16185 [Burkholderiaceae bacterium]
MIHCHRGNVLVPLGLTHRCLDEHGQALRWARAAGSPEFEALALSGLGDGHYLLGRMRSSCGHFDRCVERCRANELRRIEGASLAMRGATRFYSLEIRPAIDDVRAALDLAIRVGNRRAEAIARNVLGYLLHYAGEYEQAGSAARDGLALARALGSKRFEIKSLLNLGLALGGLGQWEAAERALDEATAVAQASGVDFWAPWTLGALALAACDDDKRRSALAQAEDLLARGGVGHGHLHFRELALETALARRDPEAVEHHARRLESFTRDEPLAWSDFLVTRARALSRLHQGLADASDRRLLERLREQALAVGLAHGLAEIVEAHRDG